MLRGGGINNQLVEDSKVTATGDTVTSGNFIFTELSDGTYSVKASSTSINGAIEIPSSYNGKAVTQIASGNFSSGAFVACESLVSVTIPDSVTLIGNYAFKGCTGLVSVTIGNSVTSIGLGAFRSCSALTSITIPDGVTTISASTFYLCNNLTTVKMSDNVTSIGNDAFASCPKLSIDKLPASLTSIGQLAFYNCTSITNLTISEGVTEIKTKAFRGCSALTTITIPQSMRSINYQAFYGCLKLVSATFENTEDWLYNESETETTGTEISSLGLADPATAATYLKSTYRDYYWHCTLPDKATSTNIELAGIDTTASMTLRNVSTTFGFSVTKASVEYNATNFRLGTYELTTTASVTITLTYTDDSTTTVTESTNGVYTFTIDEYVKAVSIKVN